MKQIFKGITMETEYEPVPANQYEDSYASTPYRDDYSLAVGCGVTAVLILFLTIVGLVVLYV
jgi:hypothetical protein